MVQNPPRPQTSFPATAPTAYPVFYRTYSRQNEAGERESWQQVCDRTLQGLQEVGHLTAAEVALLREMQQDLKALPSGRWLWVGGTDWVRQPENFSGAYNCTSTNVVDWDSFGLMMDLAMQGCGTGAILEQKYISQLPPICNRLEVTVIGQIGQTPKEARQEQTTVILTGQTCQIKVGDSRQGWVKSYQTLLELASNSQLGGSVQVTIDISDVRPTGERLKGFGGVANPVKLPDLYHRCAALLNAAVGRQLTSVECCLLIDEAAVVVVAGNVRRSAGIRQGASEDEAFAQAKQNLWQQDDQGNWRIDPKRDALRMANHTRVFHTKPSLEECTNAVRSQFYSGEGAIQWAGEAIARANADLLTTADLKQAFLRAYENQQGEAFLRQLLPTIDQRELAHRLGRYGLNPCVTGDTWVLTEAGPRQVKDLIGQQHGTYVNGELFSTTAAGFFLSGIQPVLKLTTREGYTLRLTANHRLLKVTAQTPKRQYTEWVEAGQLHGGDRLLLHNHRDLTPWAGKGTWEEGRYAAQALYQVVTGSAALQTQAAPCFTEIAHRQNNWIAVLPHSLEKNFSLITIEEGSYAFYCGFLREIFATTQLTSIPRLHVTLGDRQLASLIQRMLLRLGIVSLVAESSLVIQGDNLTTLARVLDLGAIAHNDSLPLERFTVVVESIIPDGIEPVYDCTVPGPNCFDANGFVAHNCGEIIGADFHCNLAEIHLNQIDPADTITQEKAFKAGALSVAALLNHRFVVDRYQYSRAIDPIVGVSFTGLFDFCVHAFGVPWLEWWAAGRPDTTQGREFKVQEAAFLQRWRQIVHETVWEYCDRHGLKRPNRCTTVQPSGTKSLLTGASPGWHPPKAQRFIRRITFRKGDPVAMACYDFGYNIIPSQSDKDETGKLLDDPFDPRCTEWLVEIPVAVSWADLPGADTIDISQFSALAQFDFYMQVQQHYTTHNTSATIELREPEVEPLATAIYTAIQQDQGYISAALLARFDAHETFPRLPFEPISKERYEQEVAAVARRKRVNDFHEALSRYTQPLMEAGPAGCDSDKCLMS
ncbi:ribonucleoside-triphosphate reductase, adenosylcobalamin-dependent [Thermosynechococcus sp. FA-CM-4201]